MSTYSASKIKLYMSCRAQYYDRYILKKKDTTKDTSAVFGSALHYAIEKYYTRKTNPLYAFNRYLSVVERWWHHRKYTVSQSMSMGDMYQTGHAILKTFPFHTFNPTHLEYKFLVPLVHPFTKRPIATIVGYIDMITQTDEVIDFKSNKRKPKQNDVDEDIQFHLYAYACQSLFGVLPTNVVRYHLRDHSIQYIDLDRHDEVINQVCDVIQAMEIDECKDVAHTNPICKRCAPWCSRKQA